LKEKATLAIGDEITQEDAAKLKEQFDKKNLLGEGSFGKVYKCELFGSEWAVKVIPVIAGKRERLIQEEIDVHRKIRARRCVLFRAAYTKPPEYLIVTEYLPGGNLNDRINNLGPCMNLPKLDDQLRLKYAIQVAEALNELHHQSPPLVHRDLKPSNILIDENGLLKLCDFGLAHTISGSSLAETQDDRAKSGAGTDLYKAPEVWDPETLSAEPSDIYSFGIVLHEIYTGDVPWGDKTKEVLFALHARKSTPPINEDLKKSNPTIAHLTESCLNLDPARRPTSLQLLNALKHKEKNEEEKKQ